MTDWDAKYAAAAAGLFGEEPNEFVREIVARSDFHARSALCLADGDGRNGNWLARQGLAVLAVDLSKVATDKARERDAASGVTAERIAADLKDWAPAPGRYWDAAFIISLHCEPSVRTRAIRIAGDALAPGGWLVIEGFAKAQAARDGTGPDDPSLLYNLTEIRGALPEFGIVEAFTGITCLDEGKRHRGEAEVVRFAARKLVVVNAGK